MRVAAGGIARKLLAQVGIQVRGALIGIGQESIDRRRWDWDQVGQNPFFTPDAEAIPRFKALMEEILQAGDSVGATLEVCAGLGQPVFDRLDADLAKAMMGINAVKGVEIGDGMAAGMMRGSEMADEMQPAGSEDAEGRPDARFLSNHAGGILGGISTGQEIWARLAIKPTSSIRIPRRSMDRHGKPAEVVTHGRHDPCVGIRAVPIAEAMMALVLADHFLKQRALKPLPL